MAARKIPVLVVSGSIPLPFTYALSGRADTRRRATVPEWSKGVDSRPTGFVRASSNLVGRTTALSLSLSRDV